jgi:hypothetical protein
LPPQKFEHLTNLIDAGHPVLESHGTPLGAIGPREPIDASVLR